MSAIKNTGGVADLPSDKEIDGRRVISATSPTEAVELVLQEVRSKREMVDSY